MNLRIIGDVHGKYTQYKQLLTGCNTSIQLGDMGYVYPAHLINKMKTGRHYFFKGNHDNYHADCSRDIGDFGEIFHAFCMRGAFSVDKKKRLTLEKSKMWPKTWFEEEQMSQEVMERCLALYEEFKPRIVVTHTCPDFVARDIGSPGALRYFGFDPATFQTRTQQFFGVCYKIHQPKLWVFGHFHKSWHKVYDNTTFRCLKELESLDIETSDYV